LIDCSNVIIEDNDFNTCYLGIRMENCSHLTDNKFIAYNKFYLMAIASIKMNNCNNIKISENDIGYIYGDGVQSISTSNIIISSNKFEHIFNAGFVCNSTLKSICNNNNFVNCQLQGVGTTFYGVIVVRDSIGNNVGCNITNNNISTTATTMIPNTITGIQIHNDVDSGIYTITKNNIDSVAFGIKSEALSTATFIISYSTFANITNRIIDFSNYYYDYTESINDINLVKNSSQDTIIVKNVNGEALNTYPVGVLKAVSQNGNVLIILENSKIIKYNVDLNTSKVNNTNISTDINTAVNT